LNHPSVHAVHGGRVILLCAALAVAGCRTVTPTVAPAATPAIAAAVAPATAAAPAAASVAATPAKSALDRAVRRGNVLVGGQPSAADLAQLKPRGIARVINLRTPEEMNDRAVVDFDEAALLAGAGIEYVQIPIGGNAHPFRPEALEAYARALDGAPGEVFLHCASGNRASTLHAAWEVKYRGKDPDTAMRELQPYGNWPLPIERLTGIELKVERRAGQ
jgi:uncharacterized protein (TIGR01244 family)